MTYRQTVARALAMRARQEFGFTTTGNIDIFSKLAEQKNFTIIFVPFADNIDGFSSKFGDHYAIVINSRCSVNRRNFTCAHELYHLLYEYNQDKYVQSNISENMANTFASYFLISEDALYLFMYQHGMFDKAKLNVSDIVKIEDYFQVSRFAILMRLRDEGLINQTEFDKFNQNVCASVMHNGGNLANYLASDVGIKKTTGEYVELAKKLLEQNKISRGKFEEYMIDAFNLSEIFGCTGDEDNGN